MLLYLEGLIFHLRNGLNFDMSNTKIIKMLKEIVIQIDYDIYKELFIYSDLGEVSRKTVKNLIEIVKKYGK